MPKYTQKKLVAEARKYAIQIASEIQCPEGYKETYRSDEKIHFQGEKDSIEIQFLVVREFAGDLSVTYDIEIPIPGEESFQRFWVRSLDRFNPETGRMERVPYKHNDLSFEGGPEGAFAKLFALRAQFLASLSLDPKTEIDNFIAKLQYPGFSVQKIWDGFSNGIEEPFRGYGNQETNTRTVVFVSDDEQTLIAVNVAFGKDWITGMFGTSGTGHTWYRSEKGWVGFDRRGLDDSFTLKSADDFAETMGEQIERIQKSKDRSKGLVPVPGTPFSVHRDEIVKYKKLLSEGRSFSLTPGGFGTGYRISAHPNRYTKLLPQAAADLFGTKDLFFETFDHD